VPITVDDYDVLAEGEVVGRIMKVIRAKLADGMTRHPSL
jgi:hypothetical protein